MDVLTQRSCVAPHLQNRSFRLVEDMLSAPLIQRRELLYFDPMRVVMHPEVKLHRVKKFLSQRVAIVDELRLSFDRRQFVIDQIE